MLLTHDLTREQLERVEAIVREDLAEGFKDLFVFNPIWVIPYVSDAFPDDPMDFLRILIIFDCDENKLASSWTVGMVDRMRPKLIGAGVNHFSHQFVHRQRRVGPVRKKVLGEVSFREPKVKSLDLVSTARLLAEQPRTGRPPETNLRRAISTAYYALFHHLAENCADMVVGGSGARRSRDAWQQVYRALDHSTARRRCREQSAMSRFPSEIRNFGDVFVQLQELRQSADYDPHVAVPSRKEVSRQIDNSEDAIRQFPNAPIVDRRSFAVHVLMSARRI